jgi:hypothetical protein
MNIGSEFKAEAEKKRVNLELWIRNQKNEAKVGWFCIQSKIYKVELGFSARDIGTVVGNSGNVILDGVFFYKPTSISQLVLDRLNYLEITNVISSNSLELRIVVSITQSLISTVI